jgi:ABC-type transporter Mla subunit MlaD
MSRLTDSALAPGRLLESLATLPATLEKLLDVIGDLHAEMRKMNKEVVAMRKGMDALSVKVSGLQDEFQQTREAVVDMTGDVHRMSDDVNQLVPSIEGLREDLGRLPFVGRRRRGSDGTVPNGTPEVALELVEPEPESPTVVE